MDIQVQQQIANIVNTENARVDLKKSKIDNELQTQNRLITLNNSYRQKYNDYNKLYIIFIVFLVILCGIMLTKRYFPNIPTFVFDIAFIIIIPFFFFLLLFLLKYKEETNPLNAVAMYLLLSLYRLCNL